MNFRRYLYLILPLALATILAGPPVAAGQTTGPGRETSAASVASYRLSQLMPVDPEATVGTLPNGLRYYVRPNGKPAHRAELRLVVKAGSVLEDDDQKGLAHFVEHMLFEGTQHFPGSSIGDFLASLGLSIGPDANAATSYNSTQYTLRVPTDVPGVLDRALLVLEDWTHAATFDQSGINRERGIVLSEWRMNLGASERTGDAIRRVQLDGSRYAIRPVIGDPDIISNATREALVRFYHDWYRPDLMSVIVVGDIDRDAVVDMIRSHFSSLTSPRPERPRQTYDVPEHAGTRYTIVTDKETTATTVELNDLRPAHNQGTVGGYREIIRDQLFSAMLSARFNEVRERTDPPFLRARADRELFGITPTRDEASLEALVSNDGVARGLDSLVTELQRVVRFGFTSTELAREKESMMRSYERSVTESPDRESASRADEYTRNFMQAEALPTIWQELAFHRRFLPEITLAEINALVSDWFPDRNRLVVVSAPDAAGVVLPTQAQLADVVRTATARRSDPYVDTVTQRALLDAPPTRGTIVRTVERPEAGITEWTLSNGATVVLKPTMLKEDQILFRAFALGGTSLASDADFASARVADTVIPAGGAGAFSLVTLDKMLAGKAIGVSPFIGEIDHGMQGGSTPQDLETMFQLLYLRFAQPRADPATFAAIAAQAKALVANQDANPDIAFNRAIDAALADNNRRREPETASSIANWDLAKALAFYKARFGDASSFTFVFVGSFTLDAIKPLIETYVASLPATHAHESWRDLGITLPSGKIEKTLAIGIAPKSNVSITLSGPFQDDAVNRLAMRTVTLLLQSRLFDTIRQDLGGTYSITATLQTEKFPRPQYEVRIEWTCDPARTASLVDRVWQEIAFVRDLQLSPQQLSRIRETLLREFERDSQDNAYVLNAIARDYEEDGGKDVADVEHLPDSIAALTSGAIHDAARMYLSGENSVTVIQNPERR
ncbi:MAG TPA: insulinase family protein [Vicinamibacterales bacterium]|nr:insulinase family protein [Vicinamibacterales bacterium]